MVAFKNKIEEEFIIMATVGQQLAAPEAGWRRYDDTDSRIQYIGAWSKGIDSGNYDGSEAESTVLDASCSFKFYGTKIRIIAAQWTNNSNVVDILISGVKVASFSQYGTPTYKVLSYEITGLSLGEHMVELVNKDEGKYACVDAIDIDDTGYLLPFQPEKLTATAGDAQVSLSWDAVSDATQYTVKRSTIAGGPYTVIASGITGTSYADTDVVNGTTYYYVVTAVDSDGHESDNSNEASATPHAPGGHGLLRVTMSDSSEREYELTDDEISQFIAWCSRTVGTGNSLYSFDKTYNIGEFKNRKEYLMFEKIIGFEVMELSK